MSGDGWDAEQARCESYADPFDATGELAAYAADLGRFDCWHDDDELEEDDHLAQCLGDAAAARRLAQREGKWDAQGTRGYEL